MTDGIAWLAEPQSIAWGGYGVVIARDLASETLAARVADTVLGPPRDKRSIGELTGRQVQDLLEGLFGDVFNGVALRHGEIDEWAYVVKCGGWQGEFGEFGGTPRCHAAALRSSCWSTRRRTSSRCRRSSPTSTTSA